MLQGEYPYKDSKQIIREAGIKNAVDAMRKLAEALKAKAGERL